MILNYKSHIYREGLLRRPRLMANTAHTQGNIEIHSLTSPYRRGIEGQLKLLTMLVHLTLFVYS
jgi:hypothetical protein